MTRYRLVPILALATAFLPITGWPRTGGTAIEIRGTVQDRTGSAIPGAVVELSDEHERLVASGVTGTDGFFRFKIDLTVRDCTIEVRSSGFKRLVRPHLKVEDLTSGIILQLKRGEHSGSAAPPAGSLRSAPAFSDNTQLKAGALDDPSAGGGYSDSVSLTRSELIRDYARGRSAHEDIESVDLASASPEQIDSYGSALVLRQNFETAARVFERGVERYPQSGKLQLGLGTALYGHGRYEDAVRAWLAATEIGPAEAQACMFLAKASISAATLPPEQRVKIVARLGIFAFTDPGNARAHYYFGAALLKAPPEAQKPDLAREELAKAVSLDPGLAEPHFELGNLAAEQRRDTEAIREYREAIRLRPDFAAPHYRLAQVYQRIGEKSKGQAELDAWEKLRGGNVGIEKP